MSDYTILNLREVEDVAPKFDMPDGMEARFPRRQLGSEQVTLSLQKLAPGGKMPFGHSHAEQEELYVVVAGSGRVKLDDEIRELRTWDVVRVPAAVVRSFEAAGEGLELIAIGAPMGHENDAELVPGWWSD
jgi:mannose-6-phosphate isomerase-like protein (cupin superfamily)